MAIPSHLPQDQVAPLLALYDGEVRARRRTLWIALAVLAFCILVAGRVSEIDFPKFIANFHSFPNYILRIFYLENGAVVFSDIAEWFWGIKKWLLHIGDTLLIAYLGTLMGALGSVGWCGEACEFVG